MIEFKLCPFCGGQHKVVKDISCENPRDCVCWIECSVCGGRTIEITYDNDPVGAYAAAAEAWNTRYNAKAKK